MSTLKVSEIRNASSATGGLSIAADGSVSGALPYPNRNLLYNGAMQVAQRGTSTTGITTGGYYTADRWYLNMVTLGTWTQSVEADGPTGSGLTKSLKLLCTTADAAPAAADLLFFQQRLEGQDVQRVTKGTASAQKLTVSFWVKSNVTGTYIAELFDVDNTRQISASYTISASATWEKKVVTFNADTTGALDNDNAGSLFLTMWLGAGTNYTSGTLNTSWASNTNANRAVGQTNLAAATNNYWQVTGVQLEVGDTATEFEHLPFGVELARCQRYYYKHVEGTAQAVGMMAYGSASYVQGLVNFPVTMRAVPSLVAASGTNYYRVVRAPSAGSDDVNSLTAERVQTNCALIYNLTEASGTAGYAGWMITFSDSSSIAFNSEL